MLLAPSYTAAFTQRAMPASVRLGSLRWPAFLGRRSTKPWGDLLKQAEKVLAGRDADAERLAVLGRDGLRRLWVVGFRPHVSKGSPCLTRSQG